MVLIYPKTNFMFINKYPHKSVGPSFSLNDIALKRVETIEYLGISIDEILTRSSRITQLTLELSRYAGHIYILHSYAALETLCTLYYTLFYSKIQYGTIVWVTANKTSFFRVVKVKLNKI